MNDIFSAFLELPPAVKGLVTPTPDGDYQIIINSAYTFEQQLEIYNHEMRHILLGHYQQPHRPLAPLEAEAADRLRLLGSIRKAEREGLPLISAITRQAASPQPTFFAAPPPKPCPASAYGTPAYYHSERHRIRLATLTGLYL